MKRLVRRALGVALTTAVITTAAAAPVRAAEGGVNDPDCQPSAAHPNPVVFLHGLGANKNADTNVMQDEIASQGYCTYSLTYGAHEEFPFAGGLRPIADSAQEIRAFILDVLATTGASTVDIVGHSEGGFQSLYVTKTQGIADKIDKVIAIAPPTHGTTFGGLYALAYVYGDTSRDLVDEALKTVGCAACTDLGPDGDAVEVLTDGPIAQHGVTYTIITSTNDQMVTPTETSFVPEPGVDNKYVQETCPHDPVGHIGEAYDTNVWNMVTNALDPANAMPFPCSAGFPF